MEKDGQVPSQFTHAIKAILQCPDKPTPDEDNVPEQCPSPTQDLGHHHFVLPLDPYVNQLIHFTFVNTVAKLGQGFVYTLTPNQ